MPIPDLSQTRFLLAAPQPASLPPDDCAEVAFAGRSNAGKSSALNVLCSQRKLARTSKTPGRTQAINFFALGEQARLADLPGYGFARVPPRIRAGWQALIERYLTTRANLRGVVLIMDSRRPLTDFDRQMLAWGETTGLRFHILLTKADKLGRGAGQASLLQTRKALPAHSVQLFSATARTGIEQARAVVTDWLQSDPIPFIEDA